MPFIAIDKHSLPADSIKRLEVMEVSNSKYYVRIFTSLEQYDTSFFNEFAAAKIFMKNTVEEINNVLTENEED